MHFDHVIFQTLFALFAGILFFLGITLVARKLPVAYKILGITFFIMAIGLVVFYMTFAGLLYKYPHFTKVNSPLLYLWGPLHFLFVRYLIYPDTVWKRWYWLLFVPAVLHLAELLPYLVLSAEEKRLFVTTYMEGNLLESPNGIMSYRMHVILKSCMVLAFCFVVYHMLRSIVWNSKHLLYEKNRLLLNWVLIGLIIKLVCTIEILMSFVFVNYIPKQIFYMSYFLAFADTIFYAVYLLVYPNLLQGVQWTNIKLIESQQDETPNFEINITTSCLSEVLQKEAYISSEPENPSSPAQSKLLLLMDQYMQFEQPYLNSNLTLEDVASKLGAKPYKLSREIKTYHGISFSDLVNSYRLNYVEEKIRTDILWKTYSIERMALKSGFGSRAAFYVAFRKLRENIAPTAYYGLK